MTMEEYKGTSKKLKAKRNNRLRKRRLRDKDVKC